MLIMHASDLHYSPSNLVEADRCFGFAVEDAIKRNVAVALITGDSTDHRLEAHSPALLALAKRIKQLADHCPVFMLQGTFSHEPAGMLHILGLIGAKYPIIISDRVEMIGLCNGKWSVYQGNVDEQYDLVITSIPTLNKADLAPLVGIDQVSEAMGHHLAALLGSYGAGNKSLRTRGVPTVLASHGTIDGSMSESGVPMAGLDHEFSVGAIFSAGATASMLGHIHKHQVWKRECSGYDQLIAYSGSIGRFHYGQTGNQHYLLWDVDASNATIDAVATPSKCMIEIDFDGVPNLDELQQVAAECGGAFVKVRYSVDQEHAGTVDANAIKQILSAAAELKIERTVLTVQRQRCAGISMLTSIEAKFGQWVSLTSTPPDGLNERLSNLQTMDAADIVASIIRRVGVTSQSIPYAPATYSQSAEQGSLLDISM
jgi:exonuclease SbcD